MTNEMLAVLKAARDPNKHLYHGEICISAIAQSLNMSFNDVQNCLIRLESTGIIKVKRTTQYEFYLKNINANNGCTR